MDEWQKARLRKLDEVEAETKRFLKKINAMRALLKESPHWQPIASGAVRRSSLDLSRALADFRRPLKW